MALKVTVRPADVEAQLKPASQKSSAPELSGDDIDREQGFEPDGERGERRIPEGERFNNDLTPDDVDALDGVLQDMPDEIGSQSRIADETRRRRIADAEQFLSDTFPADQRPDVAPARDADEAEAARAAAAARTAGGVKSGARRKAEEGRAPGAAARDIMTGVRETPRQVAGGLRDAVQAAINLGDWLADTMEQVAPLGGVQVWPPEYIPPGDARLARDKTGVKLPDIKTADSATGKVVREVSQFLTGFGAGGKVMGAALKEAPKIRAAVQGALADFSAFDAHEERLANLIQKVPELQNPVTEFLAAKAGEGEIEGRLKRALEGLGLGVMVEGMMRSLKYMRDARRAQADADAQLLAREEARAPEAGPMNLLGDEAAPLTADAEMVARLIESTRARQQAAKLKKGVNESDPGVPDDVAARSLTPDGGLTPLWDGDKSVFVNFSRITSTFDVQRVIKDAANAFKSDIDAARRGVRSNEQTLNAAGSVDAWDALMKRRQGAPMNAEESVAARRLWEASAAKLMTVADTAARTATPENLFQFRKMLAVHHTIQKEVVAARTETARALQSWKIPVGGGGAERLQAIENILASHGGAEVSALLASRIAALRRSPNGLAALDGMVNRGAFAKSVDVVKEIFINSILSNPQSHVVNMMGNTAGTLINMVERAAAARYSQLLGSGDVQVGEAAALAFGMKQGTREGFRLFVAALRTGETQFGATTAKTADLGYQRAISADAFDLPRSEGSLRSLDAWRDRSNWLGNAVDGLSTIVNGPVRFLGAEDDFFKALGYRMEVNAQAFRQAQREVHDGLLARDLVNARIAELAANPPEHIRLAATDAALYQSFTRKPGVVVEGLNRMDARLATHSPAGQIGSLALRLTVPFRNTPANLMKFTFERTPLAPLMQSYREAVARGGADADIAFTRMALGSMVLLGALDLAFDGHLTGSGPKEKDSNRGTLETMKRSGWQEYSVRIGDKYVSYKRSDPVGMTLGIAADLAEIINNVESLPEDRIEQFFEVTAAATATFGNLVLDKNYMSGLSDFIDVLHNPRKAPNFIERIGASLTVPNASTMLRRGVDDNMRYTHDLVTRMKERVPGLSSELPPARDMWGRVRKYQSGIGTVYDALSPYYAKTYQPEAIDAEALKHDFNLMMPNWKLGDRALRNHPEVYSRLLEVRGTMKPSDMGDGAKAKVLIEKYGDVPLLDLLNSIVTGENTEARLTGRGKKRAPGPSLSESYAAAEGGRNGGKDKMITRIVSDYGRAAAERTMKDFPKLFRETVPADGDGEAD